MKFAKKNVSLLFFNLFVWSRHRAISKFYSEVRSFILPDTMQEIVFLVVAKYRRELHLA